MVGPEGRKFSTPREAMKSYVESIQPPEEDAERLNRHRNTIRDALNSEFDVQAVRPTGSRARGTAVRDVSDSDYLAVVPRGAIRWGDGEIGSDTLLANVRKTLQGRKDLKRADIYKDGQAIVLELNGDVLDVVPAVYVGPISETDGSPVYRISDGANGWIHTSPDAHAKFIREANEAAGGRLLPVLRAMKSWKGAWEDVIPIKSIYLDAALANSQICNVVGQSHPEALRDAFFYLANLKAEPITDPTGVPGTITAASTDPKRERVVEALGRASELSRKAVEAEERGKHNDAMHFWDRVFNRTFVVG